MKHIYALFVCLFVACVSAAGEDLWIYAINSSVELYHSQWQAAKPLQKIALTDSLRFGENASVTLLDREKDRLYAVQGIKSQDVNTLVNEARGRKQTGDPSLVQFLWESARGNNSGDKFRHSAGVIYRDKDINVALASVIQSMDGNLPVEFELIDQESGEKIGETATIGQTALIKVKNYSALAIFVNLIDIDATGNISPCIPVSSATQMGQLLIPVRSEVILTSLPIVFTEPQGRDELILIASPEYFNIYAVVEALKSHRTTSLKVNAGVFKLWKIL